MSRNDPGRAAFNQILDDYRKGIKRAGPVLGEVTEQENKIRVVMAILLAVLVALAAIIVGISSYAP